MGRVGLVVSEKQVLSFLSLCFPTCETGIRSELLILYFPSVWQYNRSSVNPGHPLHLAPDCRWQGLCEQRADL